ncbi:hypothetical protein [Pseudomonas sp. TMB3-21]
MTDYSELKIIAEACQQHQPLRFMRSHGALYIRNDNGIVFDVHQNRSFPEFMAQNKDYADLVLAANPATVLALIAENERLSADIEGFESGEHAAQVAEELGHQLCAAQAMLETAYAERDHLKAENAGLKTGYEAYEQVVQGLKAENEVLRKLVPSKEIIWCACGDGHAANSYGAGFMDANNGVCANCDAAMSKEPSHG